MSCDKIGECGGCTYKDLTYDEQIEIKKKLGLDILKDYIKDDVDFQGIVKSPLEFAYRNKMEFSFGDEIKDGPLTLGMHKKKAFYSVLNADKCELINDDMKKILNLTLNFFREKKTNYFHRVTHKGYLRHLILRYSFYEKKILINLVTTSDISSLGIGEKDLLNEYKDILLKSNVDIKGILRTKNDTLGDIVKNEGLEILYGEDFLIEEVLGFKFKISPFSFFQTNTLCANLLYGKVREYLLDGLEKSNIETIYDLYCGTGTIAQILSPYAKNIYGIEIVKEAIVSAKENLKLNDIKNVEFYAEDIDKMIDKINIDEEKNSTYNFKKPDVIILDPARAGVNIKSLDTICRFNAKKIIYVSCKITSLKRDLEAIIARGYKLKKLSFVDMFPWTENVETVCLIER